MENTNNTARPLHNTITVLEFQTMPDGSVCLIVPCPGYVALQALPAAVEYTDNNGKTWKLGRTGWNSDSGVAYYKNTACFAKAIG